MGTQSDAFSLSTKPVEMVDFEAVYQTELPRVYNFFRYRVGDDQVAEDLTAETFEKAWRKREQYRADLASFSTWLFALARRVAADYFRKKRPTFPLEETDFVDDVSPVEDLAQERAEFAQLAKLLARLADRERELVALKYGAGLTNRDIARLTGLSETNVSTILSRVTQQLRAQWKDEP
jgi:RNA polymerase sigma-70 factor (ECF subfamily)